MLLRVTNEFGAGFTVFATKDVVADVRAQYEFMGYKVRAA
jgi:hypothetical protein